MIESKIKGVIFAPIAAPVSYAPSIRAQYKIVDTYRSRMTTKGRRRMAVGVGFGIVTMFVLLCVVGKAAGELSS